MIDEYITAQVATYSMPGRVAVVLDGAPVLIKECEVGLTLSCQSLQPSILSTKSHPVMQTFPGCCHIDAEQQAISLDETY